MLLLGLAAGIFVWLQAFQDNIRPGLRDDYALLIPRGCAHGFQVLSAGADLLYLHDAAYDAAASRSVHVESPVLGITLPLPVAEISDRDRSAPRISEFFEGVAT